MDIPHWEIVGVAIGTPVGLLVVLLVMVYCCPCLRKRAGENDDATAAGGVEMLRSHGNWGSDHRQVPPV